MWRAIIDHARAEAPRECCGVLAGRDGVSTELYPLPNIAPGNRLYEIDPQALYELEFRTLPDRHMEVLAIYHSHPATEAYPSETDQAQAFWPDATYLICSLALPESPVLRAFRLDEGCVREVAVVSDCS